MPGYKPTRVVGAADQHQPAFDRFLPTGRSSPSSCDPAVQVRRRLGVRPPGVEAGTRKTLAGSGGPMRRRLLLAIESPRRPSLDGESDRSHESPQLSVGGPRATGHRRGRTVEVPMSSRGPRPPPARDDRAATSGVSRYRLVDEKSQS